MSNKWMDDSFRKEDNDDDKPLVEGADSKDSFFGIIACTAIAFGFFGSKPPESFGDALMFVVTFVIAGGIVFILHSIATLISVELRKRIPNKTWYFVALRIVLYCILIYVFYRGTFAVFG